MFQNNIRIFDYAKFAEPFGNQLKQNAQRIAEDAGLEIEYIRSSGVRKEAVIEDVIKKRGTHPGLVHIISVMEGCTSYKPWHDKTTHKTFLKYDQGKCLSYYFYFIDELLGLCYVRVPTWLPFKLQIFFNRHASKAALTIGNTFFECKEGNKQHIKPLRNKNRKLKKSDNLL